MPRGLLREGSLEGRSGEEKDASGQGRRESHTAMIIPHRMLSPDTLRGVIEAFVIREGTDYGAQEVPLETKVMQVHQQLEAGTAVIVYDAETESCTIQPTNQRGDHPGKTAHPKA